MGYILAVSGTGYWYLTHISQEDCLSPCYTRSSSQI